MKRFRMFFAKVIIILIRTMQVIIFDVSLDDLHLNAIDFEHLMMVTFLMNAFKKFFESKAFISFSLRIYIPKKKLIFTILAKLI